MRAVAIVWAVASMAFGCAAPSASAAGAAGAPHAGVATLETPRAASSGGGGGLVGGGSAQGMPGEAPDRDPAARGQLAVDMSAADLPDDRDGDGVDQLDLCPELPPDRVDGCPHAR